MIRDSGAKAVLVTPQTEERARGLGAVTMDCTSVPECAFGAVDTDPLSPAVILYSSGTTGEPKGSMFPRRGLENLIECYCDRNGVEDGDVVGMYPAFVFDMAIIPLFCPCFRRCTVDIVPEDVRRDMALLHRHIDSAGITDIFLTT